MRTLRQMLGQAGFHLERAASISGSYPTFALSVRFWAQERLSPRAQGLLRRLLDSAPVRVIAGPFFYVMDHLTYGTVVTVVARPQEQIACRRQASAHGPDPGSTR
jgi:hypothetical protein